MLNLFLKTIGFHSLIVKTFKKEIPRKAILSGFHINIADLHMINTLASFHLDI